MYTMTFEVEISDWANWVAQDKNGDWFEYEYKPKILGSVWEMSEGAQFNFLSAGIPSKNWKQQLYQIVRK